MAFLPPAPPAPDGSAIGDPSTSAQGSARTKSARPTPVFGQASYAGQVIPVSTTITASGAETVIAAAVTGETHHLARIDFQVTAVPTACTATLRNTSGGAAIFTFSIPATVGPVGAGNIYAPWVPGVLSANWTLQLSSALPTVVVNLVYANV